MAKLRTHYDNLKVARNAPDSVIKAAYKALCQQYHPDKFQGDKIEGERIIKIVKASYEVLIDPTKRAIHDRWIKENESSHTNDFEDISESEDIKNEQTESEKSETTCNAHEEPPKQPPLEKTFWGIPVILWRRFFARIYIDYSISTLLLITVIYLWSSFGLKFPDRIILDLLNDKLSATQQNVNWLFYSAFFWVLLEPIILLTFGTTPGKSLFRLHLVSENEKPRYWLRSFTVWIAGTVLSFFSFIFAYYRYIKNGVTDWDRWAGFKVSAEPLSAIRKLIIALILFAMLMIKFASRYYRQAN